MAHIRGALFLLLSNLLLIGAAFLFLSGLLRPKVTPSTTDQSWRHNISASTNVQETTSAPFDRVVFMLVDALRSDFVFSNNSGFSFTQDLIRSGAAIPFTALAGPPTLTMPRVKAMTSGASPCFLDMFSNIKDSMNRTEGNPTWLQGLKTAHGDKKLTYAGSRTWTDLYPGVFDRSHSTDANFVPDYTVVDEAVRKHVGVELHNDDWNALVLHLAGIDHIGHIGGPESPYMAPKQREIDNLVQQTFEAIRDQAYLKKTLFILVGDHGMDSRGNHGGSLESEMSAALLFISPSFQHLSPGQNSPANPIQGEYGYYSMIDQSDIVPTISTLLGIPIPKLSLGVFIPDLLPLWGNTENHVHLLHKNAIQMMKLYLNWLPAPPAISDEVFDLWRKVENEMSSSPEEALTALFNFCRHAQQVMSIPSGNISFPLFLYGLAVAFAAVLSSLLALQPIPSSFSPDALKTSILSLLYGLTMFHVSLIENEHIFWYYASLAYMAHVCYSSFSNERSLFLSCAPFFLQLITQSWNQAGENHSHLALLIQRYLEENTGILWLLITTTYGVSGYYLSAHLTRNGKSRINSSSYLLSQGLVLTALLFKFWCTFTITPEFVSFAPQWISSAAGYMDIITMYRVLSAALISWMAYILLRLKEGSVPRNENLAVMMELTGLYLMTQSRAHNIPLFLIFRLQLQLLAFLPDNLNDQNSFVVLLLSQSAYSAFGFTNSVATLDIPLGFNGVTSWVPSTIQLIQWQLFITMWAGSAWWVCAGLGSLAKPPSKPAQNGYTHYSHAAKGTNKLNARQNGSLKLSECVNRKESGSGGKWTNYLARITLFQAVGLIRLIGAGIWYKNDPALWTVILHASALVAMKLVIHTTVNFLFSGLMWLRA